MKKGRHRRYEEARALKRGSDLDIDSIFSDLSGERSDAPDDDVDDDLDDDLDDDTAWSSREELSREES